MQFCTENESENVKSLPFWKICPPFAHRPRCGVIKKTKHVALRVCLHFFRSPRTYGLLSDLYRNTMFVYGRGERKKKRK